MIEENKWGASIRYETRFPMIGMMCGTCGGSTGFSGTDKSLQVQRTRRSFDSTMLEIIKTRAIGNAHIVKDEVSSILSKHGRDLIDSSIYEEEYTSKIPEKACQDSVSMASLRHICHLYSTLIFATVRGIATVRGSAAPINTPP